MIMTENEKHHVEYELCTKVQIVNDEIEHLQEAAGVCADFGLEEHAKQLRNAAAEARWCFPPVSARLLSEDCMPSKQECRQIAADKVATHPCFQILEVIANIVRDNECLERRFEIEKQLLPKVLRSFEKMTKVFDALKDYQPYFRYLPEAALELRCQIFQRLEYMQRQAALLQIPFDIEQQFDHAPRTLNAWRKHLERKSKKGVTHGQ